MLHRTFAVCASAGRVAIVKARRPTKAAIEVTEAAAERLKDLLASKPTAVGIRVGLKSRGCNGQSYTLHYADTRKATDEEVESRGVRIFIEPGALLKIVGTSMDWKETDLSSEFVFENPNAKAVCGCGESFS